MKAIDTPERRGAPFVALLCGAMLLAACGGDSKLTDAGQGEGVAGDIESADAASPDGEPERDPRARVYRVSPTEDEGETTEVTLTALDDEAGTLTGKWADTYNCLNTDGGETISVSYGGFELEGAMCKLEKTVRPGDDGTYLHVLPSTGGDPDDEFAELMMYHHVSVVHDRFKEALGLTHMDRPLRSIVNAQFNAPALGGWVGMTNAAFIPKESAGFLEELGIDLTKGQDTIIFFQGEDEVDTAYDASVIYHEYTHAVIGPALQGSELSPYGLDPTPGALNEGLADYFAASFLETSVVGSYALGPLGGQRDLTRVFGCPDHLVGEVHWDGEIIGGALWAIRERVGAQLTDQALANAVLLVTSTTTFSAFASLLLAELEALDPGKEAEAAAILASRGVTECVPIIDHEDYDHTGDPNERSPGYAGTYEVPAMFAAEGVPSYLQHRVAIAPTTQEVTLRFVADGGLGPLSIPGLTAEMWVALKEGAAPIAYDYTNGSVESDATARLRASSADGTNFELKVAGSCIGEAGLVFQFLNKSQLGGEIKKLEVTQSDTVSDDALPFDCGG